MEMPNSQADVRRPTRPFMLAISKGKERMEASKMYSKRM
jgi:hypothetical protein